MYDKVETRVRRLQPLEFPTESYGILLESMTKIPEDIRKLLGRQTKEDKDWKLGELHTSLLQEEIKKPRTM